LFKKRRYHTILKADKILSGQYTFTPKMLFNIFVVDTEYRNMWKKFIYALNHDELKGLLLIFTNSLSLDHPIEIIVSDNDLDKNLSTGIDLKIITCSRTVIINKNLFESDEKLLGLRVYFCGVDKIKE